MGIAGSRAAAGRLRGHRLRHGKHAGPENRGHRHVAGRGRHPPANTAPLWPGSLAAGVDGAARGRRDGMLDLLAAVPANAGADALPPHPVAAAAGAGGFLSVRAAVCGRFPCAGLPGSCPWAYCGTRSPCAGSCTSAAPSLSTPRGSSQAVCCACIPCARQGALAW